MAFTRVLGPGIHTASNINSHNINSTGIITAVSFVGNGAGLTGIASTDNIITGTAATFNTYPVDINAGMDVVGVSSFQDIDVDGHTNLDNVSIAGVTTASDNVIIPDNKKLVLGSLSGRQLHLYHNTSGSSNHVIESTSSSNHFILKATTINPRANTFSFRNHAHNKNVFRVYADTSTTLFYNGNEKLTTENTGVNITGIVTATSADINGDLDVDGHTNLDNVSVAGVTTFSGNANFGSNGSITTSADFALSSNQLRVTGGSTVVGEFKGTSIPTVQVTQTTNNTDLQLRANSEGGLVRTATNYPLILGANQREKLRIAGGAYATIGINTSTFDTAGSQIKIDGRGTGTTSPPYLQIKGVGTGVLHSYVDLIATSDNNAGSAYRGLGVVMLDEPTDVEWFSGRPYAGSDKYIIGRKASPSYRTQSGALANSLLQIDSSGNLIIGSTSAEAKLDVTGGVSISSNGVTVSPSGYDLKIRSNTAKLGIHIDNASGTPILEFGIGGATGGRITTNTNAGPIIIAPNNVERLRIDQNGQILPGADDAQNLGSSTKRWKNIYAADMHFSNEGKTNDVDGTWGDWTLQEGEDSVFMINNRTGKKYAITMKEVN